MYCIEQASKKKNMTGRYMFQKFAGEGLWMLCLAVCDLDEMFFSDWKDRHQEAALSLDNRDEKRDAIYEEIERDMTLIGEWLLPKKECRRVHFHGW